MASFEDDLDFLNDLNHNEAPKVRENYAKPPFAWPGSKHKSIKEIIPLLPVRDSYIEPCGGSGAILLAREECDLEVFNDRFSGITDFYRVIKDPTMRERFYEEITPTIHSRELFIRYRDSWQNPEDPVERAVRWFYMINMSFGCLGRNFARGVKGNVKFGNRLHGKLEKLDDVARRLKNVLIENQDLFSMLDDFDNYNAVFYIDPPYIESYKGIYEHELKIEEHVRLCNKIMTMKGFVALSGYENKIYDQFHWDAKHSWQTSSTMLAQAFKESNNFAAKKEESVRDDVREVLWIKEAGHA